MSNNQADSVDPTPSTAPAEPVDEQQHSTDEAPQTTSSSVSPYEKKLRAENKRLRLDNQKFEQESLERERAKLSENERLQRELDDLIQQKDLAMKAVSRAEKKADLVGRVVDPEAALTLMENHTDPDAFLDDEGAVSVDSLLSQFKFLAPAQEKTPARMQVTNPESNGLSDDGESSLTAAEWNRLTEEKGTSWGNDNVTRVKKTN